MAPTRYERTQPFLPVYVLLAAGKRKLKHDVESVEKVPKQVLARDAEKSDLTECATINDPMFANG
jgi:hypothetical protein